MSLGLLICKWMYCIKIFTRFCRVRYRDLPLGLDKISGSSFCTNTFFYECLESYIIFLIEDMRKSGKSAPPFPGSPSNKNWSQYRTHTHPLGPQSPGCRWECRFFKPRLLLSQKPFWRVRLSPLTVRCLTQPPKTFRLYKLLCRYQLGGWKGRQEGRAKRYGVSMRFDLLGTDTCWLGLDSIPLTDQHFESMCQDKNVI